MHDSTPDTRSFDAFCRAWPVLTDRHPAAFDEDSDAAWVLWRLINGRQSPQNYRERIALALYEQSADPKYPQRFTIPVGLVA